MDQQYHGNRIILVGAGSKPAPLLDFVQTRPFVEFYTNPPLCWILSKPAPLLKIVQTRPYVEFVQPNPTAGY